MGEELRAGLDPERRARRPAPLLEHRRERDGAGEVDDVERAAREPLPPDAVAHAVRLAVVRAAVAPRAEIGAPLRLDPRGGRRVQLRVLGVIERQRARHRRDRAHPVEDEGVVDGEHGPRVGQGRHDGRVGALDAGEELEAGDAEAPVVVGQLVQVLAREERQVDREVDRGAGLAGHDQLGDEVEVVERMAAVEGQHRLAEATLALGC